MNDLTKKTLGTLEFNKVLQDLSGLATCDGAREKAISLSPCEYIEDAIDLLDLLEEASVLSGLKGNPPIYGAKDITGALSRCEKGASLSLLELLRIGNILRASSDLVKYIDGESSASPKVADMFSLITPKPILLEKIITSIKSEEELFDSASPELQKLRRQIASATNKAKEILQKMVRSQSVQKFLQDNIITIRQDRYVIPVKAEFRGEVAGLVHDMSSSGATCFIEPMAVVEANNELKILKAKEEEEIARILWDLTQRVAQNHAEILLSYKQIVEIDFLFTKVRYARKLRATKPLLNKSGAINLYEARHPLIDGSIVVPIDITIDDSIDTMVITGPNTGGKTVTLKTLGLLSIMAASGLYLPCLDGSELIFFKKVLSDLGDEQSIEQSLSTFSSHMVNIIKIIEATDKNTLVLLDELGAGTDPIEGAALAMAILEELRLRGAKLAATTHYSELKTYALTTTGVINASCEFDVITLRPTYKLIIGIPGKSNAYAISLRLGLSEQIIERAKELTSGEKLVFEDVLSDMEARRQLLEKQLAKANEEVRKANIIRAELEEEREKFQRQKEKSLDSAQAQAKSLILSAREMYNRTMAELEELRKKRDSENLKEHMNLSKKELRKRMSEMEDKLAPAPLQVVEKAPDRDLRVGESVRIRSIDKVGTVTILPDKNGMVTVQAGIISTKVKLTDIEIVDSVEKVKEKFSPKKVGERMIVPIKSEIDVRGMNGEDACMEIDHYLDKASLSGLTSITIIHGKGTGALREAVKQFLFKHPYVHSFRGGVYGEGDSGVTVVELA